MKRIDINPFLKGKLPDPILPLKQKICGSINNEAFFANYVPGFRFNQNFNCPFPDHKDDTPSFRAKEDGSFKCYGCDRGGGNIIQFFMYVTETEDFWVACNEMYRLYVQSPIAPEKLKGLRQTLKRNKDITRFIEASRGWHPEIIDYFEIGLEERNGTNFLTIPIRNEYGYTTSICYYNFAGEGPKFHYEPVYASTIYAPEILRESKTAILTEGFPDCLLALSLGYPALTFGSSTSWKDSWKNYFEDMDVIICYDMDEAGRKGRSYLAAQLSLVAASVKVLDLPEGQDLTDFLLSHSFNRAPFDTLIEDTEYYKQRKALDITASQGDNPKAEPSTLTKAGLAENYGKPLKLIALVGGKEPSPMLIPEKMQMICKDRQTPAKCAACVLDKQPGLSRIFDIDEYHPDILRWVVTNTKDSSKVYRTSLGVNPRCNVEINTMKMRNVEKVILNNPVKYGRLDELPERRLAYFLGAGLIPNRHYILDLYTVHHPLDNTAVHVITYAEPQDTELENFRISPEVHESLRGFSSKNIYDKLDDIYNILSRNVTRIWGRSLLHIAVDLPFFSVNEFNFAGEPIRRGALDILVFGDQRCGKGRVAEGLANYYRFGEVLSGENISFMNLVGGIESNDNYRGLRWGRLVANNGGTVIIDEASSIEKQTFGKLSRIRSEGIAELDKYGIHAKASARCSTVWIGNPRFDPISKYNFGVESIRDLVGQNEDIARFDYVIGVRTNEVDADKINSSVDTVEDTYGDNLHRTLILWAKTRTSENIQFLDTAVQKAYELAKELGREYVADIPLVQIENVRIKLAKIAAAIAGRLYSTPDGQKLVVHSGHVEFAAWFLRKLYDGNVLAYRDYSEMVRMSNQINTSTLDLVLEPLAATNRTMDFLQGMLQLRYITPNDIQDLTGLHMWDARKFLSDLTREGAIFREQKGYVKSVPFIDYIKNKFHEITKERSSQNGQPA